MISHTNHTTARYYNFTGFIILTILCCIIMLPSHSQAKTKKPRWKKEISSLQIGKTYRYRIKSCSKKATVHYLSNRPSCATINRKTGLLRARKKGTVTITAKIKQKHIKTRKIKTKVRIVKKGESSVASKNTSDKIPNHGTALDHVKFTVADSINPWNHAIILYSNRILLQSEVQNTTLDLSSLDNRSAKTNTINLSAAFRSLSADGKTVTYQLDASSAEQLCPGNGTQDGTYQIKSSIFQDTLQIQYRERIQNNTISGFAINTDQTSLPHVSICLYSDAADDPIAVTTTDQNGYYQFHDVTEQNITLKAQLNGYENVTVTSLHPADKNICQNIIMHSSSTKDLTLSCQVFDKQKQPITNVSVLLTTEHPASSSTAAYAAVDQNGMVTFANTDSVKPCGYTQIHYENGQSTPKYLSADMPVSGTSFQYCTTPLMRNQDYKLYICPGTNGASVPKDYHMVSFSFSFMSLLSDQLYLQIQLEELPVLSSDTLTICADTLSNTVSQYTYTLYDVYGNSIYHTSLSPLTQQSISNYSAQLSKSLQNDGLRLNDGKYYAAITAHSSDGQSVSSASVLSVTIQDGVIQTTDFTVAPHKAWHTLIFADMDDNPPEKISFILYQKTDSVYIPIGTYASDSFTSIYSKYRAYLDIPVSADTSYRLVPVDDKYTISSDADFHVSAVSDHPDATTPDFQIILTNSEQKTPSIEESSMITRLFASLSFCTESHAMDTQYFSTASTYPNTIYAYYQPDGTFINFLFSTPAFLSSDHITSMICNCMQNGKSLYTSQPSYSTTPFFVT